MPRIAAAAAEIAQHVVPGKPMEPPAELSLVEADFWRQLVGAKRFGPDARAMLTELVRAMSVAGVIAEQINALRGRSLRDTTKAAAATRSMFLQLAAASRDQSCLIASLSTKLRLTQQTKTRKSVAETERRGAAGPAPMGERRTAQLKNDALSELGNH
jgi:hypothetical protein